MSNDEVKQKTFEVITYDEGVEFKYTLPGEDEERTIDCELTLIWEDSLEKFIEEHGDKMPYKINTFKYENQYNFFLHQLESRTDQQIEEVQEEIANKTKFGFEFSGQLHNDD
ncbi:hypothetical protein N9A28_00905 [Sulfurimonas sp.]|nr:hypothetical protein [Sulfurimonas sp.]